MTKYLENTYSPYCGSCTLSEDSPLLAGVSSLLLVTVFADNTKQNNNTVTASVCIELGVRTARERSVYNGDSAFMSFLAFLYLFVLDLLASEDFTLLLSEALIVAIYPVLAAAHRVSPSLARLDMPESLKSWVPSVGIAPAIIVSATYRRLHLVAQYLPVLSLPLVAIAYATLVTAGILVKQGSRDAKSKQKTAQ